MKLLLAIVVVLVGTAFASDCNVGEVWAEGKIKMECTGEGTRPVACLPNAKVGEDELQPGQNYSSTTFRFKCASNGALSLTYEVVGCLLPGGSPIEIGEEDGIANKGVYRCIRNADGTVSRKFQGGCWFGTKPNGKLYANGQQWKNEDNPDAKYQIVCAGDKGVFEAQASGCFVGNELVQVGSYHQQGKQFFKCAADEKQKQKANYVQVGENEYYEWLQGSFGGEEESAIGDSGSGLTRPPTTPRPTTAAPVPEPTTAAPVRPTTPSFFPTTTPDSSEYFEFTTPDASSHGQCQDLHPICSTLCSSPCSSSPSAPNTQQHFGTLPPFRPHPQQQQNQNQNQNHNGQAPIGISMPAHDTEPVGFAFERSLFGNVFGGRPAQRPSSPKPSSPNRLSISVAQSNNNKPASFQSWNPQKPTGVSGSGGFGGSFGSGNSWSNSWGSGGSGGSNSWGGHHGGSSFQSWGSSGGSQGGKPSGSFMIISGGKPGGKPGHSSSSSSSSSGSSHEGHGHWGHHWGHGGNNGQSNNGGGKPGKPNNGSNSGGRPGRECFGLASSIKDLVDALCPKSCGACGRQINLQAAATKYASSKCVARDPATAIGLAVDALTTAAPIPAKPSNGGRPSNNKPSWKPSKSKNNSKNRSRGKGKKSG